MAGDVEISWVEGREWRAVTRGLEVIGDSPREEGGADRGMTPVELLVAAMGLCIAIDLSYYAERHPEIDLTGVHITLTREDAEERPSRIARITARVSLPPEMPTEQRAILNRVANGCKVSRSLAHGIETSVTIE